MMGSQPASKAARPGPSSRAMRSVVSSRALVAGNMSGVRTSSGRLDCKAGRKNTCPAASTSTASTSPQAGGCPDSAQATTTTVSTEARARSAAIIILRCSRRSAQRPHRSAVTSTTSAWIAVRYPAPVPNTPTAIQLSATTYS